MTLTIQKTKARHPQTNGIVERFHKTVLEEFYNVAFRKKIFDSVEELQKDLDNYLYKFNYNRTHQGKMCCGRTPWETFHAGQEIVKSKTINQTLRDRQDPDLEKREDFPMAKQLPQAFMDNGHIHPEGAEAGCGGLAIQQPGWA